MPLSAFRSALNTSQLEAVTYCDGPSLVIAGAGSGKTRVLTYKIAYLLQTGYEPWSILALTFTNKAAREMNERIAAICEGLDTRPLWSGTFHSMFARLLRMEHDAVGYPADYTIYDASDSRSLIKTIIKELGLDDKYYKPNVVAGRISEAKNHLVLPSAYAEDSRIQRRDQADGIGSVHKIYATYQQRLRAAAAMDFDDLLLQTYLLLRDHPEVRARYQQRFRYILVDEYQDTNLAQHRILSLLTNPDSRICVVGDDAQSIYGFRGADISNILGFQEQYPSARLIKLECNYRSTQCIVEAANSIIRNNERQLPKKVYAAGDTGEPLHLFVAQTDKDEAQKVVARIVKLRKKQVPYNEIALLYRTNAQSRSFEEALQNAAIPYRIYGGLSFYQRKEIKDVLAYFRLIANPDDEEAFRRVINYPARGIGATTVQKIQLAALANEVSLWRVANDLEGHGVNVSKSIQAKIGGFCALIADFQAEAEQKTASDLAFDVIRRSGIGADLSQERSAEGIARQENVDELLGSIRAYEKDVFEEQGRTLVALSDYLSTVSLLSDTDERDDGQPRVTLMTVHAAKGLEFDAVFVTGMEEDLFPNANARLYRKEMEEERRLFYVAVTRAKRFCFLSYAKTRYRYGNLQFGEPSPFLDEIDREYIDREEPAPGWGGGDELASFSGGRGGLLAGGRTYRDSKKDFFAESAASSYAAKPSRVKATGASYGRTPATVSPRFRPIGKAGSAAQNTVQGGGKPAANGELTPGARIKHSRFGEGVIVGVEGQGGNMKVRVDFGAAGVKNLLVKFAKFELL